MEFCKENNKPNNFTSSSSFIMLSMLETLTIQKYNCIYIQDSFSLHKLIKDTAKITQSRLKYTMVDVLTNCWRITSQLKSKERILRKKTAFEALIKSKQFVRVYILTHIQQRTNKKTLYKWMKNNHSITIGRIMD